MAPSYRRNHTASESYVRRFAGEDGLLRLEQDGVRDPFPRRPRSVGYTKDFWGASADLRRVMEQGTAKVESRAPAALTALIDEWSTFHERGEDRGIVLQFLALHVVRSPAWKAHVRRLREDLIDEEIDERGWKGDLRDEARRRMRSDGELATALVDQIPKVAALIGSMHWTLLQFDGPLLVTGDQPFASVPFMGRSGGVPISPIPPAGLLSMMEARFALDPRHALLLCWRDEPIHAVPMPASYRIAANLNIAIRAQSRQTFWPSGAAPPFVCPPDAGNTCDLIAPAIYGGYSLRTARGSKRLQETKRILDDMIEERIRDEIRTVSVNVREAA